jgi:hypothetical protein
LAGTITGLLGLRFDLEFPKSMLKMGEIGVKTGSQGEIMESLLPVQLNIWQCLTEAWKMANVYTVYVIYFFTVSLYFYILLFYFLFFW